MRLLCRSVLMGFECRERVKSICFEMIRLMSLTLNGQLVIDGVSPDTLPEIEVILEAVYMTSVSLWLA